MNPFGRNMRLSLDDIPKVSLTGKQLSESNISQLTQSEKQSDLINFILDNNMVGLINFLRENTSSQQMLDLVLLLSVNKMDADTFMAVIELGANINFNNCAIACQVISKKNDAAVQIEILSKLTEMGLDLTLIDLPSFVHTLYDHNYESIKYVLEHIGDTVSSNILDICICHTIENNEFHLIKLLLSYDHEHILLSNDIFKRVRSISVELLQILITAGKIDLQIHGPTLLSIAINNKELLAFLLDNNVETSGIRLCDFSYCCSTETLAMLLEHNWQPTVDNVVTTLGKTGAFIKLITERGANVYASLNKKEYGNLDGEECTNDDWFDVTETYDIDMAGRKISRILKRSYFSKINHYFLGGHFDTLMDHMNNCDLNQDELDFVFIRSVQLRNQELMEHALKRGANINANNCNCLIITQLYNESMTDTLHLCHKLLNLGADPGMIRSNSFVEILRDTNYDIVKLLLEHLSPLPHNVLDKCFETIIHTNQPNYLELFMIYDTDYILLPTNIFAKCSTYAKLNIDIIKLLLNNSKISIEKHGASLLNVAVKTCDINLLEFLLENGVDINMIEPSSITSVLQNDITRGLLSVLQHRESEHDILIKNIRSWINLI